MTCEECLLMIDEYAYGELAAPASGRLETHLADCADCAREHAQLRREQQAYTRCVVKAPPTLWAAIQTTVREEDASRASSPVRGAAAWFVGALGGRLPHPLPAAVAVLTMLVISAGIVKLPVRRGVPGDKTEMRADSAGLPAPDAPAPDAVARLATGGTQTTTPPEPSGGVRRSRDTRRIQDAPLRTGIRSGRPAGVKSAARMTAAPADGPGRGATGAQARRQPFDDFDLNVETIRHLEKAQMLLRSFNNGGGAPDGFGADIAYERQSSRELLARNLLLRNDARVEGNETIERLLGRLEPFLLDIANLHEGSSEEQVSFIKEQMRRKGIIMSLRVF